MPSPRQGFSSSWKLLLSCKISSMISNASMRAKQQNFLTPNAIRNSKPYLQASRLDQKGCRQAFTKASWPEDLYVNGQVTKQSKRDETCKELFNFLNASKEFQASCEKSQCQALQGTEKEAETKAAYEALHSKCIGQESCVQRLKDELATRDKALVALTLQMQGTGHQTVQRKSRRIMILDQSLALETQTSACLIKSLKLYATMLK